MPGAGHAVASGDGLPPLHSSSSRLHEPGLSPRTPVPCATVAPLVALAAALALIVVLARQLEARSERVKRLTERLTSLQPGSWVPTVVLPTTDDSSVVVGERIDGGRQLLLVFTTTCQYCRASLPAWARLPEQLDSAARTSRAPDVQVLGIALDSLGAARRYRDLHKLPYVVAQLPEGKSRALYRARAVPMVVLLDSAGRVLYTRAGVLTAMAAVDSVIAAAMMPVPAARPSAAASTTSTR